MIEANELKKIFFTYEKKQIYSIKQKKCVEAVSNVSLRVDKGQIVGVLGVNGAGKTTTIKMLTTLLEPTSGSISYDGVDAIKYPNQIKKKINLINGSERNLYWRLTGKENLEYFGRLYGVEESLLQKRIDRLFKMVELTDSKDLEVEKYSKGMKQRLQIAKGLINSPEYLFLDEPTLGLDILIAKEMRAYIKSLAQKERKGILLTTHYIFEAEELCDYIYVIHEGKIIKEGTPQTIIKERLYRYKGVFELLNLNTKLAQNVENSLKEISHDIVIDANLDKGTLTVITSELDITEEISRIIHMNGGIVKRIQMHEPTLEDAIYSILERGKEKG